MAVNAPPDNPRLARIQLLVLMLIPIGVVALATFVFYTRIGLPEGTRNMGVLIDPPQQVNSLALRDDSGATAAIEAETDQVWTFLMARPAACDDACRRQIWEIRQTHTALGKYQTHVQRVWLVTDGVVDQEMRQWLREERGPRLVYAGKSEWSHLLAGAAQGAASENEARFYLVDPRGFVMMYYRADDTYKDVITDMKFLLKGVE